MRAYLLSQSIPIKNRKISSTRVEMGLRSRKKTAHPNLEKLVKGMKILGNEYSQACSDQKTDARDKKSKWHEMSCTVRVSCGSIEERDRATH